MTDDQHPDNDFYSIVMIILVVPAHMIHSDYQVLWCK